MADRRVALPRATVALTLLLAAGQLSWAAVGTHDSLAVGAGLTLGLGSLVSALAHARVDGFETRLVVGLAVAAQLLLVLLAVTVGLPGTERHAVDQAAVLALALPVAVVALLAVDHCSRTRSTTEGGLSSYAR